jgi:hypothetical protein
MDETKDPNYTYYEEVYKAFLNSVDSYDLYQMDNDELEERLYGYMDAGRVALETYISADFFDDDIEAKRFNFKMKRYEIILLAKSMKLEWIREQKHSQELMRKSIGDRDYSSTQGYQYLDRLQAMEKQLSNEIRTTVNRIEYANQELYGDMK